MKKHFLKIFSFTFGRPTRRSGLTALFFLSAKDGLVVIYINRAMMNESEPKRFLRENK
jgi:hypothetical protein